LPWPATSQENETEDDMILRLALISTFVFAQTATAYAATARATINSIDVNGVGPVIGTVTFKDTKYGLLVTPDISGLSVGVHGFHIHDKGACGLAKHEGQMAAGFAAGGHYDPEHTGKHLGPYNTGGHKGDLPVLVVGTDGEATLPVLAPQLTVKDVRGRSLMIHAGEDNYSDEPEPLGGGGTRVACGVIE
jgi:Cu-Zn family superoxide dismutase